MSEGRDFLAGMAESSEARVIASEVDLAVFVTRLGVSLSPNAVRATDILRSVDSRIVGAFVNDDRNKKSRAYAGGISYGVLRSHGDQARATVRRDAEGS